MGNKRSIGVTIFGYLFILSGISGLLAIMNYIKIFGIGMSVFNAALSAANVICGVFILKLNNNARKAAILLCIAGVFSIAVSLNQTFQSLTSGIRSENYYEAQKKIILEKNEPGEYRQINLKNLETLRKVGKTYLPNIAIAGLTLVGIPLVLYNLIVILFFTRPKVKSQFK